MKVTLHKSTDGALHESFRACANRNIELRTLVAINAAQDGFQMVGFMPYDEYEGTEYIMPASGVPAFIAANAGILRKSLNDALIAKRLRRIAAKVATEPPKVLATDSEFESMLDELEAESA